MAILMAIFSPLQILKPPFNLDFLKMCGKISQMVLSWWFTIKIKDKKHHLKQIPSIHLAKLLGRLSPRRLGINAGSRGWLVGWHGKDQRRWSKNPDVLNWPCFRALQFGCPLPLPRYLAPGTRPSTRWSTATGKRWPGNLLRKRCGRKFPLQRFFRWEDSWWVKCILQHVWFYCNGYCTSRDPLWWHQLWSSLLQQEGRLKITSYWSIYIYAEELCWEQFMLKTFLAKTKLETTNI